jgi:hypothetical protein
MGEPLGKMNVDANMIAEPAGDDIRHRGQVHGSNAS